MIVFEKFVVCSGCHQTSTINYTKKNTELSTTCTVCGKVNKYVIKKEWKNKNSIVK